jgi:hypothetical protein
LSAILVRRAALLIRVEVRDRPPLILSQQCGEAGSSLSREALGKVEATSARHMCSPPTATVGGGADTEAAFDNLSHTAAMDRVRARVEDKRLVEASLKAGILNIFGDRQDTHTGTRKEESCPADLQRRHVGCSKSTCSVCGTRRGYGNLA